MLAPGWLAEDDASPGRGVRRRGDARPRAGLVWRERMLEAVFTLAHYPEEASVPIGESLRGNAVTLMHLGASI